MSRKRKPDAKGRSTGSSPFVMIYHYLFDCVAYRTMKPGPRALLSEFVRRYDGANNGSIVFSARQMTAALNIIDRQTVLGYARELENRGFISALKRGGFNVKAADARATEWALNWFPVGGSPPSKAFMKWRPEKYDGTEKPAATGGIFVPSDENGVCRRPAVADIPSVPGHDATKSRAAKPTTYTSLAIGSANPGGDVGAIHNAASTGGNHASMAWAGQARAKKAGIGRSAL